MPQQYECPNCTATLQPTATSCSGCGAIFDAGSTWKPRVAGSGDNPPTSAKEVAFAALGIASLCGTLFPLGGWLLQVTTGGPYGPVFKSHSPALFLSLVYVLSYVPLIMLAWLLLRRFAIMERVPYKYRGAKLFASGAALVLFYSAARTFAASIPGGGPGFVVASFSPFVLLPALGLLGVAVVRLSFGYGKSGA